MNFLNCMDLYKIKVLTLNPHYYSIAGYVLANSDEAVYEFLKTDPELNDEVCITNWFDTEQEEELLAIYDEDNNLIGTETFKEKVIRLKGEVGVYSDYSTSQVYYSWELIKSNLPPQEYQLLIDLDIATQITD